MKTLFCSCELKYGLKVCMILINKGRKRRLNAHRSFWKEKGHRNQLALVQWYLEIADGWHPWRLSMLCGYKRYQHLSIQHLSDLLGGENSPVSTGASKGSGNKKKYLRRLKRKHIDLLSNLLQLKKLKFKGTEMFRQWFPFTSKEKCQARVRLSVSHAFPEDRKCWNSTSQQRLYLLPLFIGSITSKIFFLSSLP